MILSYMLLPPFKFSHNCGGFRSKQYLELTSEQLKSGGEDNNSQYTKKKRRADLHIIRSPQPSNSCPCCHGRPCVYADVLKGLDEFLTSVRPLINCTGTSTDESKRIASCISAIAATWTVKLTHPVYSILFSYDHCNRLSG